MRKRKMGSGPRGQSENRAQMRARAFDLRIKGWTWRAIGKALGVVHTTAMQACAEELADLAEANRGKAIELRQLELEKLDRLERKMRPSADNGDTKAAMVMLRISQQRARLLGLEAAVKHEVSGPNGQPIAVADARGALAAALAAIDDGSASAPATADAGAADDAPREPA